MCDGIFNNFLDIVDNVVRKNQSHYISATTRHSEVVSSHKYTHSRFISLYNSLNYSGIHSKCPSIFFCRHNFGEVVLNLHFSPTTILLILIDHQISEPWLER